VCRRLRWKKSGTVIAEDFSTEKETKIINWEQDFVHHRIISAVKTVEFVSDRVSYVVLRSGWCNISVCKVHAPSEEKSEDSKAVLWGIRAGDFNPKVGRENIFKPTTKNESLHYDSNDNDVRIVNLATSTNLVVQSAMFLH